MEWTARPGAHKDKVPRHAPKEEYFVKDHLATMLSGIVSTLVGGSGGLVV